MIRINIAALSIIFFIFNGDIATASHPSLNSHRQPSTAQIESVLIGLEKTFFDICCLDSKNMILKQKLIKNRLLVATKKIRSLLPKKIDNARAYEHCFLHACCLGDRELITLFIDAGMDINIAEDETAMTGLMLAAAEGNTEVVETLVSAGANVLATTHNNKTALEFCSAALQQIIYGDFNALRVNALSGIRYGTTNRPFQSCSIGFEQCAAIIAKAQIDQGRELSLQK